MDDFRDYSFWYYSTVILESGRPKNQKADCKTVPPAASSLGIMGDDIGSNTKCLLSSRACMEQG